MDEQKRWHMNRMGFVNFWLYDNEIFSFCDGKLMLRGQNASGKSITTQSFIPFILDGNRSPSRLDPFGSNDRKMEYYFLGNSESDDVTGYLFMEFKKEDIEEYRTIGIGQRARRGKNDMGFWGFIILDGRRIGIDFELTNKIRDKLIPLSKKELGNRLGSSNLLFETQRDYMAGVNKYLFGFPLLEQYEQFIQLLIKVRAPKLSKEFKPSKVYDILNDSLQILTDDDLHTMVDAMQKMDDIEISLENYKKAYNDVTVIGNEYRKYNNYMLGLKARNYLKAKREADIGRKNYEQLKKEIETLKSKIKSDIVRSNELETEIIKLKNILKLWENSDLTKKVRERDELQKDIAKLEAEIGYLSKQIEEHKYKINEIESEILRINNDIDSRKYDMSKELKEIDSLNIVAVLPFHDELKAIAENTENIQKTQLRTETGKIKAMLSDTAVLVKCGIKALQILDDVVKKLDEYEKKLYSAERNLNEFKRKLADKERKEINCRDILIEKWYTCQSEYNEYLVDNIELKFVIELISRYSENDTPYEYNEFVSKIFGKRSYILEGQRAKLAFLLDKIRAEINIKTKELEEIKSKKEITPERSEEALTARKLLTKKSIPFVPFYEAVDFSGNGSQERNILIEKQIILSGLLDALIIPKSYRTQAFDILQKYSDIVICPNAVGTESFGLLEISQGISDSELRAAVNNVLCSVSESADENAVYVLSKNGYFKNGFLEGYASLKENDCVKYIGIDARKKLKQQIISERELELERLKAEAENLEQQKRACVERTSLLKSEYDNLPKITVLDCVIRDMRAVRQELEIAQRNYEECEHTYNEALNLKDKANREVVAACSKLPYKRDIDSYEEVEGILESYEHSVDIIKDLISDIIDNCTFLESCKTRTEEYNSFLSDIDFTLTEKKRERHIKKAQADEINNFLNNPKNKKIADEMTKAASELSEREEELNRILQELASNRKADELKSEEAKKISEELTVKLQYEQVLENYFEEELKLKLYDSLPNDITPYTYSQLAEKAILAMNKIESNTYNYDTAYGMLYAKYQKHSSSIASYGMAFEDKFDSSKITNIVRKRQVISAVWQGVRYSLEDFTACIKNAVDSTELLIRQKDRELFEDILSDTVSRKLTARISESREWITDMSKLMQSMDTSMGLTFSLQWKPKKSEGGGQLGTQELEKLLTRDKELMPNSDRERLAYHFRSKIKAAKQEAAENGMATNYLEMVRDALDYRKWFEFKMFFLRTGENKNELTDRAFNRFSGGEKAMAMYIPLFAAVNAQYRKSEKADHPRIIALDEAFAGVDDKNISSMFKLVETLQFDYIMNSQALWGCYETVKSLRIAELLRPENSRFITVIFYRWNGEKKIFDE